jgi:hypothetical protein
MEGIGTDAWNHNEGDKTKRYYTSAGQDDQADTLARGAQGSSFQAYDFHPRLT